MAAAAAQARRALGGMISGMAHGADGGAAAGGAAATAAGATATAAGPGPTGDRQAIARRFPCVVTRSARTLPRARAWDRGHAKTEATPSNN